MCDSIFNNEVVLERVELVSRLINNSTACDDRDRQIAIALIADLTNELLCTSILRKNA